ncbi:MAG TPA: nitroreductase family deazaflavin-dependent oxidoreductase [Thermoleophilaceae bacterium]
MAANYDAIPRWRRPIVRLVSSRAGSWWFLNVANKIDKRLIPATNGRLSTAPGMPVLVMETLGAKSGQPRRTPLLYVTDGDDIVVIASSGGARKHPAWYHNVRKRPEVRVWAPGRSGDYAVHFAQGEERARLWGRATQLYPGFDTYDVRSGAREIPVAVLSPAR